MTIENPAFCLALYLARIHFRGELHHVGHVGWQKIKCRPIRTGEIGCVRLQDELYVWFQFFSFNSNFDCFISDDK